MTDKNFLTQDKLLLLDSNFNFKKINIKNYSNCEIITFDYETHQFLQENSIKHKISEDFLQENEHELIQEKSIELASWFKNKDIKVDISYDDINLGKLIFEEFHFFILPFLKRFSEIKQISDGISSRNIITTVSLVDIVKHFYDSVTIIDEKYPYETFLHERVNYKISKSIGINLSQNRYQNLKKSSEKFFSSMMKHNTLKQKNFLLVEFDPIKNEEFLMAAKDSEINYTLYNNRRPYVWNMKSFSVLKNSHTSFIRNDDFLKKSESKKLKAEFEKYEKNFQKNETLEYSFEKFFSYKQISFWKIIRSNFFKLLSKQFFNAIQIITLTKNLLKNIHFSGILIWSEVGFHEQIILHYAKIFHIPVFLLQHGLYNDNPGFFEYNEDIAGVIPKKSDYSLSWGKKFTDYLIRNKINVKKIHTLGNPAYDRLENLSQPKKQPYILLAATSPTLNHISGHKIENIQFYHDCLMKICKEIVSLKKELIVKMHPGSDERNITDYIKKINKSITVLKYDDISRLIQNCEIFIALGMSSTILEAQIFKKPVLGIRNNDMSLVPTILKNGSCQQVDIDDFPKKIKEILKNKNIQNDIIDRGTENVKNYISNLGSSSIKIQQLLESS